MATSGNLFANAFDQAFAGNMNYASDTIKFALLSNTAPNLGTAVHWSDVSATEITGTGYTAGGITLGSKTHVVTVANSWGTTWAGSTAFATGAVIRPATGNGYLYLAESGGTSSGTAPSWPTVVGATVTDGSITWTCIGESITVLSSASAVWTTATITAYYGVLYDAQSGTSTTEPLIAVQNFGGAQTSTAGTFTVAPSSTLGWCYFTAA